MSQITSKKPVVGPSLQTWQMILCAIAAGVLVSVGGFLLDSTLLEDPRVVLYSDIFAGVVASFLALLALTHYNKRQQATMARLRVIAEMNHHVRNALTAVVYSVHLRHDDELVRVTRSAVNRIDWALRELLPLDTLSTSDHPDTKQLNDREKRAG